MCGFWILKHFLYISKKNKLTILCFFQVFFFFLLIPRLEMLIKRANRRIMRWTLQVFTVTSEYSVGVGLTMFCDDDDVKLLPVMNYSLLEK